jgi:hypothetical protein
MITLVVNPVSSTWIVEISIRVRRLTIVTRLTNAVVRGVEKVSVREIWHATQRLVSA